MMLRMLRQINRLLTALERASGMASWIGAFTDLFFHLRVFNHAFQNARPAHQNVVLLLFAELISRRRFCLGPVKVPAIEMDVGGIQVNRAGSVMVRALLVNAPGSL